MRAGLWRRGEFDFNLGQIIKMGSLFNADPGSLFRADSQLSLSHRVERRHQSQHDIKPMAIMKKPRPDGSGTTTADPETVVVPSEICGGVGFELTTLTDKDTIGSGAAPSGSKLNGSWNLIVKNPMTGPSPTRGPDVNIIVFVQFSGNNSDKNHGEPP
jgi:hypothetical protein